MPDSTLWDGGPISVAVREELFAWLDQQREAGATPGYRTALIMAAGFDLDVALCRRVVTGWLLIHFGSADKETP